MKQNNNVFVH